MELYRLLGLLRKMTHFVNNNHPYLTSCKMQMSIWIVIWGFKVLRSGCTFINIYCMPIKELTVRSTVHEVAPAAAAAWNNLLLFKVSVIIKHLQILFPSIIAPPHLLSSPTADEEKTTCMLKIKCQELQNCRVVQTNWLQEILLLALMCGDFTSLFLSAVRLVPTHSLTELSLRFD